MKKLSAPTETEERTPDNLPTTEESLSEADSALENFSREDSPATETLLPKDLPAEGEVLQEAASTAEEALPKPLPNVNELPLAATEKPQNVAGEKRLKLLGVEVTFLCFLGIITAFIGWTAENLVCLITKGIIDSRFHVLPFIPVYASIVFAVYIAFGDPNDLAFCGKRLFKEKNAKTKLLSNLLCFAVICLVVFLGELIVGNAWEMIVGVELWNYTGMPLSVTQYAGLIPALGYGGGAYLLLKLCFFPALRFLQQKANYKVIFFITLLFSFLLLADEIAMFLHLFILGESPVYWQIVLW